MRLLALLSRAPVDPGAGRWQSTVQMDRNPALVNPRSAGSRARRDIRQQGIGAPVSFSRTTRSKTRPQPRRAARAGLVALAVALAAPLAGCSFFQAAPVQRGNRADPELVAQLTPGVSTKSDVEALLGSPTATGTFDRNSWYYISSVTRMQPASNPSSENQRVVALSFDENGVLRNVEQRGPDDMKSVSMVDRTTPVPGTERTLLQALFGNIGRVGAGNLGADTSPGGGPGR